jgi:SapC
LIDPSLFAEPVPLDRKLHQDARLKPSGLRFDRTAGMNAIFVTMVEFVDVSREYPIVFVDAGTGPEGQREVAPMAVLGLAKGENLMLRADGTWQAQYVPAVLRAYPFGLASTEDNQYMIVIDAKADALGDAGTQGERLFDDAGEPTPQLEERRQFLERLEGEVQRTRMLGRRLLDLGLLQSKRFDATLPDGSKVTVDGFLALDEERFEALPEATLIELFKSGVMGTVYAHHFSLGTFPLLLQRRLARLTTGAA